jgi:hypothetical protein
MNDRFIVIISADAEWMVVRNTIQGYSMESSPFGEWFLYK